jgi:MFS family permease
MVSSIGYFGFLFGPPIIGFIAESFSLRVSFTCVAIMGAIIGLLAIKVKEPKLQRVGVVD